MLASLPALPKLGSVGLLVPVAGYLKWWPKVGKTHIEGGVRSES